MRVFAASCRIHEYSSRRLWAGGYNYQSNLFAALDRYCPGEIVPVVFAGMNDDPAELAALSRIPCVEVVQSPAFDRRLASLVSALALGLDRAATTEFQAKCVDLVFENARFFGWRLPFPTVAWFPDFQHRRLPQLFSPTARWHRDLGFRVQIASGRRIMLSSESALRDFRRFYPSLASDVSVVRFATRPASGLLITNPSDVLARYGLPPKYFYLPNQFWRHKNHQVVVDALTILKKRGFDVVVATSGSREDPRDPDYFEGMMREVEGRGLGNEFSLSRNDPARSCVRSVAQLDGAHQSVSIRGLEHNGRGSEIVWRADDPVRYRCPPRTDRWHRRAISASTIPRRLADHLSEGFASRGTSDDP